MIIKLELFVYFCWFFIINEIIFKNIVYYGNKMNKDKVFVLLLYNCKYVGIYICI